MKKILCSVTAILTALPMLAFAQVGDVNPNPSSSNCVSITHNLQYRSRDTQTGGDVSEFQDFLQSQGYLNSEPTGYFGLLTQSAAKAFQSAHGILNSGYVGPITRAKISSLTCGTAVIPPVTNPTPSTSNPTITNISPGQGGAYDVITIYGTNLSGVSYVVFYQNNQQSATLSANSIHLIDQNHLTFTIAGGLAANKPGGAYQIKVATPNGISNSVNFMMNPWTTAEPTI